MGRPRAVSMSLFNVLAVEAGGIGVSHLAGCGVDASRGADADGKAAFFRNAAACLPDERTQILQNTLVFALALAPGGRHPFAECLPALCIENDNLGFRSAQVDSDPENLFNHAGVPCSVF